MNFQLFLSAMITLCSLSLWAQTLPAPETQTKNPRVEEIRCQGNTETKCSTLKKWPYLSPGDLYLPQEAQNAAI